MARLSHNPGTLCEVKYNGGVQHPVSSKSVWLPTSVNLGRCRTPFDSSRPSTGARTFAYPQVQIPTRIIPARSVLSFLISLALLRVSQAVPCCFGMPWIDPARNQSAHNTANSSKIYLGSQSTPSTSKSMVLFVPGRGPPSRKK